MTTHDLCDGHSRRDFLAVGALAGLGLDLGRFLSLPRASGSLRGRADAAIFIRLAGGPSHLDTFDLKPGAPSSHRGEFKEIATNVPGIRFCEHLPKLARCADKFAIVRGVSHTLAAHELGSVYLQTGNRPLPSLRYPTYGAVVAKERGATAELPAFVAIPRQGNDATGFLGVEHGPLETGQAPRPGQAMEVRGLALRGVTLQDLDRREAMLQRYDRAFGKLADEDRLLSGIDEFQRKAFAMMRSERTRAAFDLTRESASVKALFSDKPFAQSCLLATRLVEAGVRFVTVELGGWDTHQNNFPKLRDDLLPNLDDGLAGLLCTLAGKGLLDSTSVFVTGEFGRTPRISPNGGRNHHPRAMFCLLAGGGIRGGQVLGASDARGELPDGRAIKPDDVAATFYATLGIDHRHEYHTSSGRPVQIVRDGVVLDELL